MSSLYFIPDMHQAPEVQYFENLDLTNLETPVNPDVFEQLLNETGYDTDETKFVIDGFCNGFDIGYQGTPFCKSVSKNLPFTIGNKVDLWNKLMKEIKLKSVAGPFDQIPFDHFIQSPIGLVPKAGGDQTRLIFHLSFDFGEDQSDLSVNACTPRELCTVVYNNLDHAVQSILILRDCEQGRRCADDEPVVIYLGKSDVGSAFRVLPLSHSSWPWVVMHSSGSNHRPMEIFCG